MSSTLRAHSCTASPWPGGSTKSAIDVGRAMSLVTLRAPKVFCAPWLETLMKPAPEFSALITLADTTTVRKMNTVYLINLGYHRSHLLPVLLAVSKQSNPETPVQPELVSPKIKRHHARDTYCCNMSKLCAIPTTTIHLGSDNLRISSLASIKSLFFASLSRAAFSLSCI